MALTIFALLLVGLFAAVVRDRLDPRSAEREALRDALDRGEIKPEDYARALQSAI